MIYLKRIIEEYNIYETLDRTHSVDTTINLMSRWFLCSDESGHNHCQFSKSDEEKSIKFVTDFIIDEKLKKLLESMNNLGWEPSHFMYGNDDYKFDEEHYLDSIKKFKNWISLYFEAKYNVELSGDNLPNEMYHLTSKRHLDKIQKIGLAPKSKEKIAKHSERIYLANSLDGIKALLNNDKFYPGEIGFVVLSINIGELLKRRVIKFFEDPMFSDYGVYTYENIPPQFISIEKEIKR